MQKDLIFTENQLFVHGDLNPATILRRSKSIFLIGDLPIFKFIDDHVIRDVSILSSFHAPEIYEYNLKAKDLKSSVDIYSLDIIL